MIDPKRPPLQMQLNGAAALCRLREWDGLKRLDDSVAASRGRPNIFAVARRALRVEGVHSDLLRWLLDPRGWHGLGDRFAQRIVSEVTRRCGRAPLRDVEIRDVEREFDTTRGPVDLLLHCRSEDRVIVVAIENKIDSEEGHEQLRRYGDGLVALFPSADVYLALLAPDEITPDPLPACPWSAITYGLVVECLTAAIGLVEVSAENLVGTAIARHYLEILRGDIMGESNPEIDALCAQLYEEHRNAWHVIRRRLPTWRDEFHDQLGASVCRRLEEEHGGAWSYSVRRDRFVAVFRPSWGAFGERSIEAILGLKQASKVLPLVHFRLAVGSPQLDEEQGSTYEARLKVGRATVATLGERVSAAVIGALGTKAARHAGKVQFTHPIKTSKRLPAPLGQSSEPSGRVVAWYADQFAPLVPAIDNALTED